MSGVECRLLCQSVMVNWLLCVGRCGLIVVCWSLRVGYYGSVAVNELLWVGCCVDRLLRVSRCGSVPVVVAVYRLL